MKNKFLKTLFAIGLATILFSCSDSYSDHGAAHTFNWTPADTRAIGYNIYCGTSTGTYTTNINVPNGAATSYPVLSASFPDGVNYCAMASYNFAGESALTAEISFTTQGGDLAVTISGTPLGFSVN